MGAFKPDGFDPLELEIIDSVYDVVWKTIAARDPYRDTLEDAERQDVLRRRIFAFARQGRVDFDTLCDKVLGSMAQTWMPPVKAKRRGKAEGGTPEA